MSRLKARTLLLLILVTWLAIDLIANGFGNISFSFIHDRNFYGGAVIFAFVYCFLYALDEIADAIVGE